MWVRKSLCVPFGDSPRQDGALPLPHCVRCTVELASLPGAGWLGQVGNMVPRHSPRSSGRRTALSGDSPLPHAVTPNRWSPGEAPNGQKALPPRFLSLPEAST